MHFLPFYSLAATERSLALALENIPQMFPMNNEHSHKLKQRQWKFLTAVPEWSITLIPSNLFVAVKYTYCCIPEMEGEVNSLPWTLYSPYRLICNIIFYWYLFPGPGRIHIQMKSTYSAGVLLSLQVNFMSSRKAGKNYELFVRWVHSIPCGDTTTSLPVEGEGLDDRTLNHLNKIFIKAFRLDIL